MLKHQGYLRADSFSSSEMSLHVLAYNMKKMIRIFGVGPLLEAMRA